MAFSIINEILKELPEDASITLTSLEGPNIILFTRNPTFFRSFSEPAKELAKKFKKRVEVRADTYLLMPPEEAKDFIKKIVPPEAGLSENMFFESYIGRVVIEADKPGLVIGKSGATLNEIRTKTFWTPVIERRPSIESKIINSIRETIHSSTKFRRKFLRKLGSRIYTSGKEPKWSRISTLGGCREVGRSCFLLQTPESKVLLDCGINVARTGEDSFPVINIPEVSISDLDAVIITHAHLDHSGFVPYLYTYGYDGPVYCTAPTRDLMTLLQLDYISIAQELGSAPYKKQAIEKMIKRTITLNYSEVVDITPDVKITLHNTGHILGSAGIHLHIGEGYHNVVYTGDIKFAKSRLLECAQTDFARLETLIIESTYGGKEDIQPSRHSAEKLLIDVIKTTLARKGKVLIPVLGVGRAQEVMVLLDYATKKELLDPDTKVYIDGMVWDATAIYTAYPEFLSEVMRKLIFKRDQNPFLSKIFKRVGSKDEREEVITGEPCVILATSGMLTGGPSVEYLRHLADSPLNTLIFINYQAEGSLGKKIQNGWSEIPLGIQKDGKREILKIGLDVFTIDGFSAHSDRNQLLCFVQALNPKPQKIIVTHGEASKSLDIMKSIHKYLKIETTCPKNLECIRLS
jgi:hypothetical protein